MKIQARLGISLGLTGACVFFVSSTFVSSCSLVAPSTSGEEREAITATSALSAPQTLLARGASWQYWDNPTATTMSTTATAPDVPASAPPLDGSNAWKDTLYNAEPRSAAVPNGWASGPAVLGYTAPSPSTRLRCDPANPVCPTTPPANKFTSYYFRTTVEVPPADFSSYASFRLRVLRDDAVVVYVNGVERGRSSNLPAAPAAIGYQSLATSSVGTASWTGTGVDTFDLDASAFVPGTNVIAVELHQQSATSSDVAFDAELTGMPLSVTRGPFLQVTTPTSTIIRWRTSAANAGRVRVGPNPGVFTATFDESAPSTSPFDHEVQVTGLVPGTRYYYDIGTSSQTLSGGDATHFFRTSPDPSVPSPALRIWAFGDSGRANDGQRAVRDAFLPVHAARPADVFILLGDNAYESGRDDEYQSTLFDIYPTLLRSTPLWPTHGNHETAQSHVESSVLASPYFNIFTLPVAAEAGGVPSGSERYYSWNWGSVHFISLDPQTTTNESSNAARTFPDTVPPNAPVGTLPGMLTWLTADLQSNTRPWVIAYSHHPPYTKGTHDSDSSSDYESALLRKYVLPRLEQYGVDLMLSGHSHVYERSRLIRGHHGGLAADGSLALTDSPSSTFDPTVHVVPQENGTVLGRPEVDGPYVKGLGPGTIYAVVGTGGSVGTGSLNHPVMVSSFSRLGSLIIDVEGDRLDAKFLNTDGSLGDSFTLLKGSSTNALPAVSITSPASGASAADGVIQVSAAAMDADGIAQVTFFKNLVPVATVTSPPYQATLTGLFGTGSMQLIAEATDTLGARRLSLPVSVGLTAAPPGAPTTLSASPVASAPGQISLSWGDPDNVEQGFELERSANDASSFVSIGRIINPNGTLPATRTFIDSGLDPSVQYFYRVRGFAQTTYGPYSNIASAISVPGTPSTLVRTDSMWSYRDDGASPPSWASPTFDDSAWPIALAELGYGDGDEKTVVSFGPNANAKFVTTYFRRSFTVADPASYPALTLRILRDDGAVVYLNGAEVFRTNMPGGVIDPGIFASAAISGSAETTFFAQAVNPALLVAGRNVLAVEVHQSDLSSGDLSFNLELVSAATALAPGAPLGLVAKGASPSQVNLSWTKNSTTESGFQIERSLDNFVTSTVVGITAPGASTFSDVGLAPGTQYAYRVRALSNGEPSAAITASARTCDLETCDGVDNDCDGVVDNTYDVGEACSSGVGQCTAHGLKACSGPTSTTCTATPLPPSPELCDDLDNDCNGLIDDATGKGEACVAGVGTCVRSGVYVCTPSGGIACNAAAGTPSPELCDGEDNDCNGAVDETFGIGAPCTASAGGCTWNGYLVCAALDATACRATSPQTCETSVFLHRERTRRSPGNIALTLDHDAPSRPVGSVESSSKLSRERSNPWRAVGTWTALPEVFVGTVTAFAENHLWLKDNSRRSVEYDVMVELFRNGTLLASGEQRCLSLQTNAAIDVMIPVTTPNPVAFNGTTDELTYKVSVRMGTTASGAPCGGRAKQGDGLAVYFDAVGRASGFTAVVTR